MADLLDIAGVRILRIDVGIAVVHDEELRSEEHTSELQCQISYAVFCLKKKRRIVDESPPAKHVVIGRIDDAVHEVDILPLGVSENRTAICYAIALMLVLDFN